MRGIVFNRWAILLAVTCSALAGCQTKQPGIKVEYVDRPVVKIEKCLKKGDLPKQPGKLAAEGLPPDIERALSLSLATVSAWQRYGSETDKILERCIAD